MTAPLVVLDACALIPIRLATTLLWLAEAGLFQPLWSAEILDEVERNLPRVGVTPERARRRVTLMQEAFGPEATVEGFDSLIGEMSCDAKDRHVLAAGVRGGAEVVLTFNLKDFPEASCQPHGIRPMHPDAFLMELLTQHPEAVVGCLEREVAAFRRPPLSVTKFLASLAVTVPLFANMAADAVAEGMRPSSDIPALVAADESEAMASFGPPGDLTNPAQVAALWWSALIHHHDALDSLTYEPAVWEGYAWAVEHLEGRSLASKVLYAVDAPDEIAFMRFVPEVSESSQVFEGYLAPMTFLTLVRIDDGTWRVWGLGPGILSAREIRGE